MNVFSGIFWRGEGKAEPAFFNNLKFSQKWLRKPWTSISTDKLVFASQGLSPTLLYKDDLSSIIIAGDCTLYKSNQVINDLDALKYVVKKYKEGKDELASALVGEFSFVIWDPSKEEIFCMRDQMGLRPLYYFISDEVFFFSNSVPVLSSFNFSEKLDNKWLISFFENTVIKAHTLFENIKSLSPGYILCLDRKGYAISNYWHLNKAVSAVVKTYKDAIERFKELLFEATDLNLNGADIPAIELSGGIDSITIATIAALKLKIKNTSLLAFTNALPEADKTRFVNFRDEWDTASIVAKKNGLIHFPIQQSNKDPLSNIDESNEIIGYPAYGATLFQKNLFLEASVKKVDVLLTGFGGNELVSEYANVSYINSLLKQYRIKDLTTHFINHNEGITKSCLKAGLLFGKFLLGIEAKNTQRLVENLWNALPLRYEVLNENLKKDFVQLTPYPPYIGLREKSIYRVHSALTANRITAGYHVNSFYGINYRHPLLHIPLMEFYFCLPDEWKVKNKLGRGILRDAMRTMVPGDIINQPKYTDSATVPYARVEIEKGFYEMKERCLTLPENSVIFEYIDKQKIAKYVSNDWAEYGTLIRIVMMHNFLEKRKSQILNEL